MVAAISGANPGAVGFSIPHLALTTVPEDARYRAEENGRSLDLILMQKMLRPATSYGGCPRMMGVMSICVRITEALSASPR